MATNLVLKSQRQIKTDILTKIIALLGLNDINAGSVLDVITDAVSQEDFAQYVAMAQIARLVNLDSMTGVDLDNKAFEYGLTRQQPVNTTGIINILRPASFVKVATTFYAGSPAPIIGNTTIDVNNASSALIGTSGTLILGRDTANEEEVTYSAPPVNFVNFWRFTVSPLAFNHAVEESVILKQGIDEPILAGTQVQVQATGTSAQIIFVTTDDATLLSGEAEVDGVGVIAAVAGTSGNIALNAINGTQAFTTPPFAGARAQNPSQFTTGLNLQTDDSLRDAIRNQVQSLSRGVVSAIQNAINGLVDPVSATRVVSSNIILPQGVAGPVLVYIDDGFGLEPTFEDQGYEDIIDSARGGEIRIQLNNTPLVKAQVECNSAEPYNMSGGGLTLSYTVGTVAETITFQTSDFQFPNNASAGEVVTAINARSTLIEARTSEGGTQIVITGIADTNEDIQVTSGTANAILNFPTHLKSTLFLYIDDELQSKDGATAVLDSGNLSPYNFTAIGASPWYLDIVVDNKTANPQVVTFQTSDFVDPSNATVAEVVAVINAQLAGVVAEELDNNTRVRLVSNTLLSAASQLHVTGGSANNSSTGLNFGTTPSVGLDNDYTLNRELGTIQLNTPLLPTQTASAGSLFTRAKLRAGSPELYSPATGQTLVFSVDGGGNQTVTFDNTFSAGQSAAYTAAFINAQLFGATAIVRQVGIANYLEINTNTYDQNTGSLIIQNSSTANASFSFPLNSLQTNQRPDRAYQVSGNTGPYQFAQGDSLIIVLDNDIVNDTYSILMNYAGAVSTGLSTTSWSASPLANIFPNSGSLINYYAAFTSGANTTSGTVSTVSFISGNTWEYAFATLPVNLAAYAIGDLISFAGLADSSNNGYFIITAISASGSGYVQVTNVGGIIANAQTGSAILSQRRQITAYSGSSGIITVGTAFSVTPTVADPFLVIPSTVTNLVNFISNLSITAFSLSGIVEGVENNTKLQLSSQSQGSDGYIEVSGGLANNALNFSTALYRGLQAYSYYTGLLALVHKTIYGDDTNLTVYPGIGAAGITFYERTPTIAEISVNIDVVLNAGVSLTSIQNSIQSAITGYINNLGVGNEVVIEGIKSAVYAVPGVFDLVLNFPTANMPIGGNQLARTKASLIVIG